MLFLSSVILTFGKSFISMVIYRIVNELAFMFWNMTSILLRNNLIYLDKKDTYYTVRNKAKVMYGIITMITALISGYLFNVYKYLPMYISIIIYFIIFIISFVFYEAQIEDENNKKEIDANNAKIKLNSAIFYVVLSNAIFYSIIKLGQNNSKLFMQYDFQKVLSIEMVTYYITTIVFVSRIARIIGKLILGHFIEFSFILKVIVMSSGFFLILAIRDSFQVYIEDTALRITNKDEQQKVMVDIEVYRKLGQLLLSGAFTLILMRYELIVIEFILLLLSIIEVIINKKMCRKLEKLE